MNSVNKIQDLGENYGDGIYEAEIEYLVRYEFVHMLDDILWRRSKLGLQISERTRRTLERVFPSILNKITDEEHYYDSASGY